MAEKYKTLLNQVAVYSATSFCFSLAKETGMFKTLLDAAKPLTSEEIAGENKIKERYAREMLGCLSAIELAKVSTNEDGVNVYYLEETAKEALNGLDFSLAEMNFPVIYGSRYEAVKECLGADKCGAVRYQQSFINALDDHKIKLTDATIDCLLKNVPGLKENLEKGIDVIEFGCGNAYHLSVLATMFPKSQFVATDVNPTFLEPLKKRYSHIPNLKYDVVDLCAIPEVVEKKYDLMYLNDVVHDLPHPAESLKGIKRMMKETDSYCTFVDFAGTGSHIQDVGNLHAAFKYAAATLLCIPESYQNPDSEAHGAGIGKDTMMGFMKSAGFETEFAPMGEDVGIYIGKHSV